MKTEPGFQVQRGMRLNAEDVHLWRVNISAMTPWVPKWMSILSEDEQKRASRFHRAVDRNRFVTARALLRQILGSYLSKDCRKLVFTYSEKEKPSLGGEDATGDLGFNISHSGNLALLAFGRSRDIGVDVEEMGRDADTKAIAARFFSAKELEELAALPGHEHREAFFRCWTRKESFIKATGKGLSLPLRDFDVSLKPGDRNALLATRPDPLERMRWTLRDVAVDPGYAAALCVTGNDWRLIERTASECGA